MSRKCELTGKRTHTGNNRPFCLKATRRTFRPNLFKKRVLNPETGRIEKMTLSAKAIKTLKKWSLEAGLLVDWKQEAKNVGVQNEAGTGKHVHKEKLTPKQKKELAIAEELAKKEALAGKAVLPSSSK